MHPQQARGHRRQKKNCIIFTRASVCDTLTLTQSEKPESDDELKMESPSVDLYRNDYSWNVRWCSVLVVRVGRPDRVPRLGRRAVEESGSGEKKG